jgi:hypothetical protein
MPELDQKTTYRTAPQGELIAAVLSAISIVEIARLRDFL